MNETLVALKYAYIFMFYVISPLIWIYLISVATWVMITVGRYLRYVPIKFEILVEPRHPDKLGGLKFLGDFCLGLSYPILIGIVLISLLKITQPLSNAINQGIGWGLVLVAPPTAYFAFFAPLWGVNKEMKLEKGMNSMRRGTKKLAPELKKLKTNSTPWRSVR